MSIEGTTVKRREKKQLCDDIATHLGIPLPETSSGASIDSDFLLAVYAEVVGGEPPAENSYRLTEYILQSFDLTYDPFWDTSEGANAGGGTVTSRAFSRIRSALYGFPRCFILAVNDADIGARWETSPHVEYRYNDSVSGRRAFNDAGPGSRILYYATSKSSEDPKHFVASSTVNYIHDGWAGPWRASFIDYQKFGRPVPVADVTLTGWNRQNSINEIEWETYQAIVTAGEGYLSSDTNPDFGGEDVAKRVRVSFQTPTVDPELEIPPVLPVGDMHIGEISTSEYVDNGDQVAGPQFRSRSPRERTKDREAELRAIDLVTAAFQSKEWELVRDCQADGVGYDLKFACGGRKFNVEVKGIQSRLLAFNLTPKEWWRAETDPEWVLVAVTNVLSPVDYQLHLITRDVVLAATRYITGYRVTL